MGDTWPRTTGWPADGRPARWQRLNLRPLPHQQGSLALGSVAGGLVVMSPAPEAAQQAEHFEIQPDQVYANCEARIPLQLPGSAAVNAPLDEVEVEQKVGGG